MIRANATTSDPQAGILAAAFLVLSVILGGGGSPAPVPETVLQILAAIVAALWILLKGAAWRNVPRAAWIIALLIAVVPLLQLIPLPPGLWHALPGRENERDALSLVGAADTWRALTLSPPRTLAALLAALTAGLSLIFAASLGDRSRQLLVATVAAMGILTLVVGAAQLSGGAGNPFRFYDPEEVFLTGFQANHNSTADLILIAMLALAASARILIDRGLLRPRPWQLGLAMIGADAVFGLALFLAGSRAGIALLPLVLAVQFAILQPARSWPWGKFALSSLAALAVAAASFLLLRDNREFARILDRFTFKGEFRPELWNDAWFALGQYWPAGSGMGNFVPVMVAVERLEVVDPTLPNRAHNDYLELAVTGGLPGLIVLVALAVLVAWAAWKALRHSPAGSRPLILFAVGTLGLIAAHSLVDYPLRSMSLAAVAATAVGLLLPPRQDRHAPLERSLS